MVEEGTDDNNSYNNSGDGYDGCYDDNGKVTDDSIVGFDYSNGYRLWYAVSSDMITIMMILDVPVLIIDFNA